MAKALASIIGGRNLTGVINSVQGGVPTDVLPPRLFQPTGAPVQGDTGTYFRRTQTRKTARQAAYGSKAREREMQGTTEVPVKLIHSVESQVHKPATLMNLMSPEGVKQRMGEDEVAYQTGEFARLFGNLRTASVFSALSLGLIYFDGAGNLLPSSTGAVVSVDFSVPAGNKDQLDWDGNGAIIGASWGTAGTSIIGDLEALQYAARALTGLPLRHAIYGANIPGYLLGNTQMKELFSRAAETRAAFIRGAIPNGILDLTWWPGSQAFYQDNDGTNRQFVGGDTVIFLPEITSDWWMFKLGTYPVPRGVGQVTENPLQMVSQLEAMPGMFSYTTVGVNPVSIEQIAGDTFLPIITNPNAIFIADVTPRGVAARFFAL
jgi:hypothetical protein